MTEEEAKKRSCFRFQMTRGRSAAISWGLAIVGGLLLSIDRTNGGGIVTGVLGIAAIFFSGVFAEKRCDE